MAGLPLVSRQLRWDPHPSAKRLAAPPDWQTDGPMMTDHCHFGQEHIGANAVGALTI
jgi:hypothetical protein